MPLGERGAWPLPRPTRLPGSRRTAVIRCCTMAGRFRCATAGAPSGRQPTPDPARQAPPPGSTVGLPCGSGLAFAPACWVGGAWQQAKGGDAWWAARRRAGPGRSASRPDRGSTRAAGAPAGPGPVTPVRAPGRPETGLPGVPRPRPAVLQPRRPAVPGARHRATGGGAQPAVAGQGDDEGRHCPGTGAAMTLTAGGRRRRGAARGWRPAAPTRRGDGSTARASRPHRRWRRAVPDPLR